ncbi:protein asteroid [Phlebotomus argentipes]|uniref:protein asteroid n=1 Tax=Phlebotomus argentipes TaxID=94469 RepID=UPI0028936BA3|nr:protein asteroid [Phlebotomus argentipes]
MGVKGLTTYIGKNAKKFLSPHELHDCNLVIDGDNLACQLFRKVCETTNCAFGGDYDMFYMQVCRFFTLLDKCNVKAYVLLDGGYEIYRLRTVHSRLRSKIAAIKHLDPTRPDAVHFPLLIREVFVRALRDMKVEVMRCLFEADEEVANLAKHLNCPVLSYDSDFYIYNVLYIPFVSLTLKVYKKIIQRDGNEMVHVERCSLKARKRNRKARVPVMDMDGEDGEQEDADEKCYYYLDCCLYRMENLMKHTKMTEELLPFFGAIIGNDITQRSRLRKFYCGVNTRKKRKQQSKLQRQIDGLIHWLQHETLSSALEKLEIRTDKENRESLLEHVKTASASYTSTNSISCVYFGFVEETEENELEDDQEICEEDPSEDEETEEEESKIKLAENPAGRKDIPPWLKSKFLRAELPRYCIDLIHLKMYVNNPQIENYKLKDANLVALDILLLLFRIFNAPETPTLNYLTRLPGQITYANKYLTLETTDDIAFDPEEKSDKLFRHIFCKYEKQQEMFSLVPALSSAQRLYTLAIVYWTRKSKLWTWIHIRSLILSMMILSFVDKKCGEIRSQEEFEGINGKTLQRIKAEMAKKTLPTSEIQEEFTEPRGRQLRKKISKNECVIIQERIIPFLSRNVHHKKSYTDFSSTILHGFSEFQAVLYHMITLNSISNFPFEEPHVAKMYKGFLLFNLYSTLKKRDDPEHYLRANLLNCAHNFWSYYDYLMTWLRKFIPEENA